MHTVELFEEAVRVAGDLGYRVRIEPLDGPAGSCVVGGRKLIFVDLAASPADRLETLLDALREEPNVRQMLISPPLANLIARRRAA